MSGWASGCINILEAAYRPNPPQCESRYPLCVRIRLDDNLITPHPKRFCQLSRWGPAHCQLPVEHERGKRAQYGGYPIRHLRPGRRRVGGIRLFRLAVPVVIPWEGHSQLHWLNQERLAIQPVDKIRGNGVGWEWAVVNSLDVTNIPLPARALGQPAGSAW